MASSLITPLTFTGVSQYSSDFQSILTRAVQLASLPAQQLSNQRTDIASEQSQISSLGSAVSSLTSSLVTLGKLGSSKALVASSSDSSVVTATATGATAATSYSITNLTSVARAASESSLKSYSDATAETVSTTGGLELTVGSTMVPITLASGQNNLSGVVSAINAANAGVTATILTTNAGDYLSVSANSPGATTLTLTDGPTATGAQLLTSTNQGANSVFDLNGVPVSEPSTRINNVIPGLTLNINGTTSSSQTVTVSLSSDRTQLESALQNLVTNYNAVANQVAGQTGSSAGLLSGNTIIGDLRQSMLNLVSYNNTGSSIHSLAELGITLSSGGQMSFDSTQVESLSSSQLTDAFSFLGSSTTGFGALQTQFQQISDPITGTIKVQEDQYTAQSQKLTDQIGAITDRVNIMQAALQTQLEQADALMASLASQQNILVSSINALNYTTYGSQTLTNSTSH